MDRIKLVLLLAVVALSSCAKRYECVCIYSSGPSVQVPAGISKEVTGRSHSQAEAKCKRMGDPASGDCVLR